MQQSYGNQVDPDSPSKGNLPSRVQKKKKKRNMMGHLSPRAIVQVFLTLLALGT